MCVGDKRELCAADFFRAAGRLPQLTAHSDAMRGQIQAYRHKKIRYTNVYLIFFGGDKRDRTADLLNAIQALSQLSYTPIFGWCSFERLIIIAKGF